MDIHEFRDFVNRFQVDFVIRRYSDVNGKNHWSCLCSAMDWLTEAGGALPEFERRAHGNKVGWIDLYGYISCIDVIMEATEQLYRCVFGVAEKPTGLIFPTQCFVTKPEGFSGLSDRAFFKELRAGFGAHPVNLDTHDKKSKRFASWMLSAWQSPANFDFSVRLYSNLKGVSDSYLGVNLAELKRFCDQYRNHLESVAAEIKRQYGVFANECRKRPIVRSADPVEQWNILMLEAGSRCLGNWDAATFDILSAEPKSVKNRKLLVAYQKVVRALIDRMIDAFQSMDEERVQKIGEGFHQVLYPTYPLAKVLSYSLGKLLTSELPYSVLKKDIEAFFGSQIDFRSIRSDAERRVLVRAALYILSQEKPSKPKAVTLSTTDIQ